METTVPGRRVTRLAKILMDVAWWSVMVGAVLAGRVFSTVNGKRLLQLGWLLIAAGLALPGVDFLHSALLVRRAGLEGVPFSIGIGSLETVFPGILVLVVAGAWRYGAELQRDRDLVV